MRRISVENKIIILIVFAILAVIAAGILAYNSINFVLATIKKEARPNNSLITLKEINNNLQKGESNIEYFTITGETKYLRPYKEVEQTVDDKIHLLIKYNQGNIKREAQIDTIRILVDEKFELWEKILECRKDDRVSSALNKLSDVLETAQDTIVLQVSKNVVAKKDSVFEEQSGKEYIEGKDEEKKERLFSRWFKRRSENEKEEEEEEWFADTVLIEEETDEGEIIESENEAKDTTIAVGIDKTRIYKEIDRLKQQEGEMTQRLTAYEVSLRQRNDQINEKLSKLISKLEKEELDSMKRKAEEANRMVDITNKWSMIFLLMFLNLLISVIYVIQRYIRKSHATQKELTKAKDAALKLSQTKEQFMANMSHEIRTPMNSIVGFTEQILQMPLSKKTRESLEIVKKSADHLLKLINDILDFSKLEVGKLTLEEHPFMVEDLLKQAYQLYKPSAELKSINLLFHYAQDSHKVLIGDSFRLRQIMFNLISNAIKFTEEGCVKITAHTEDLESGRVKLNFEILDSGIGIPEEKLLSIFEEFTQAESSTSRYYGGTGLGLAIVRRLVKLHNGTIQVRNNPDKGACFYVSVECEKGDEKDLPTKPKKRKVVSNSLSQYKIIVADDDEYNQKLIEGVLIKWEVKHKIVGSGKEMLDILSREEYDLVLLDIHMPEMNGIEVAKKIRSDNFKGNSKIPIIAVTATIAKEELRKCNEAGINAVLPKPYKQKELLSKVMDVLMANNGNKSKDQIIITEMNDKKKTSSVNKEQFKALYDMANNDNAFVYDMLQMFLKTTNKGWQDLQEAYGKSDWGNLAEYAHKIKAPCKHLDAVELSLLLKELELTSRKGEDKDKIKHLFEEAEKGVNQLSEKVKEHIKNNFS